jgi:hypothetical protein
MKFALNIVAGLFFGLSLFSAQAQLAGAASPQVSVPLTELFGEHKAFTATIRNDIKTGDETLSMPCKMYFLDGKCRLDIDLTQSKGTQMAPGMAAQLKTMGMAEMTIITATNKDTQLLIYPGLKSYAEIKSTTATGTNDAAKAKMTPTELGKESIEGHPCVKNKVIITDAQGKTSEAIVWNASDLKNFPVRIDTTDENTKNSMIFSAVKFDKPDAKLFDAPAGYTRYTSVEAMLQQMVTKIMQGADGLLSE